MTFPDRPRLRELVRLATWIVVVWLLFGSWSIFQRYRRDGLDVESVADVLVYVLVFATITPAVIYASERLPVRRPHRLRNFALLTIAGAAFAIIPGPVHLALVDPDRARVWLTDPVASLGLWTGAMFILLIVLVTQSHRITRENAAKAQAEAELGAEVARAQLQQLRADLDPHFLFNSLNSVLALVRDEPREAERMLRILSDLLRRSFTWLDREITLREEVAFAAGYLEVQRMRFGDRLSVDLVIPPQLEDVLVPPLIIQPLVENAVVHGVARLPGSGRVVVSARSDGERLVLHVRDSGPGFEPSDEEPPSIGIPNTRARLRLMYGDAQSLAFRRQPDGFVAEVTLPVVRRGAQVTA